MIKDIVEKNIPKYAKITSATVTLNDMGERTIEAEFQVEGRTMPDFSFDWELEFQGERYIMPLREPQIAKDNQSVCSKINLTFYHWAEWQLKRYYFFEFSSVESGTAIADKYIADANLNLGSFVTLCNRVLSYYFGKAIKMALSPDWEYDEEPSVVNLSYTTIWDLLTKLYETWSVRWDIQTLEDGTYNIRVGYPSNEIEHIFQYGHDGGATSVERSVQNDGIKNIILGRGGEKNLPYRYFKDTDPLNPTFKADPDWIPELQNIYFAELRGKSFRDYIKGWKTNPNRLLKEASGLPILDSSGKPLVLEKFSSKYAAESEAYAKGASDEKFNPCEYVRIADSVAKYGEFWGGLENNEDIYPSIEGVERDGLGRIDQCIDVEQIEKDDYADIENDAQKAPIESVSATLKDILNAPIKTIRITGRDFTIPDGKYGDLLMDFKLKGFRYVREIQYDFPYLEIVGTPKVSVFDYNTGKSRPTSGIPSGSYRFDIEAEFRLTTELDNKTLTFDDLYPDWNISKIDVTLSTYNIFLLTATPNDWKNAFNVWVKNIWESERNEGETDEAYASRIWTPILGNQEGEEARVMFTTGELAFSSDYEFKIIGLPKFDDSKVLESKDGNTYASHWCLHLAKSDADKESLGVYTPNTKRQGRPGDYFAFLGIDIPHQYVLWAEERLDDYKREQGEELADSNPTFTIQLDKIRIFERREEERLVDLLRPGSSMRLADPRFIINEDGTPKPYENFYLASVTYQYGGDSSLPDVEITLTDKYETSANPIATVEAEVSALAKAVGNLSNVEQAVRVVGDRLYLRKDGIRDVSTSPTSFANQIGSMGFRNGLVGGEGWGLFKDSNGNWVCEVDRLNVRQDLSVNNLVINQVTAIGGTEVLSCANLEISSVVEGADGYECFFDQHMGSVGNMFATDDVAWCNRMDAFGNVLKFYKRKVVAVSQNSITLSKVFANGEGIPAKGDVVVQYGNYSTRERQCAMIRDAKGGGAERFLEGLDSVNASGIEYYFVGVDTATNPQTYRFFLGDDKGYIEYRDKKLKIKGEIDIASTFGGQSLSDFIKERTTLLVEYSPSGLTGSWHSTYQNGDMYMRQSGDNGKTWSDAILISPKGYASNLVLKSNDIFSNSSYQIAQYRLSEPLVPGKTYTATIWGTLGDGKSAFMLYDQMGRNRFAVLSEITKGVHTATLEIPSDTTATNLFIVSVYVQPSVVVAGSTIQQIKIEAGGNLNPEWTPAPADMVGTDGKWVKYQWGLGGENTHPTAWEDTPLNPMGGQFVWMRQGWVTPPKTEPEQWLTPIRLTGEQGVAGQSVCILDLSNEMAAVPCDNSGNPIKDALPVKTTATVYVGGEIASGWDYQATFVGCEGSFTPSTLEVAVSKLLDIDKAQVEVVAKKSGCPTLTTYFNIAKVRNGESPIVYALDLSTNCITRLANGELSEKVVDATKYKIIGNKRTPTLEKRLFYSLNGGEYKEAENANHVLVPIHIDDTSLLVELRDDDGTTVLDRERVPILSDANSLQSGGENLLRNSDFLDGRDYWDEYIISPNGRTDLDFEDGNPWANREGCNSIKLSVVGATSEQYNQISQDVIGLAANERYVLSGFVYIDPSVNADGDVSVRIRNVIGESWSDIATLSKLGLQSDGWVYFEIPFVTPEEVGNIRVVVQIEQNGSIYLNSPKLERGNHASSWSPSALDVSHLRTALKNNTSINGGLILATQINLGKRVDNEFKVGAGMSGAGDIGGRDKAIWAGGDQSDSLFGVRYDGSVYACGGDIAFEASRATVGKSITLDAAGLQLVKDDGTPALLVGDFSVGDTLPAVANAVSVDINTGASFEIWKSATAQGVANQTTRYFFKTDKPQVRSIGAVEIPKGSVISVSVGCSVGQFNTDVYYSITSRFYVCLRRYIPGGYEEVQKVTSAIKDHAANININFNVVEPGLYDIAYGFEGTSVGTKVGDVVCSFNGNAEAQFTHISRTVLGNDGLLSVWPNAAILIRGGYVGFRAGNFGLRARAGVGFEATTDGEHWNSVELR